LESMYGGGGLDTDLYLVHLVPHAYVTLRLCGPVSSHVFSKCNNHAAQPIHRFLGSSERVHVALHRGISCDPCATLHARIFVV
jgi:hypothetical protein